MATRESQESSERPKLRLGAFMRPVSIHTAAWRYPGGTPDANFNLDDIIGLPRPENRFFKS